MRAWVRVASAFAAFLLPGMAGPAAAVEPKGAAVIEPFDYEYVLTD